jgi:hypothetical protein
MASPKAEIQRPVSIEYKGQTYNGYRIITGSNKLFQSVHYGLKSKHDGHPYRPKQSGNDVYMENIAQIILRELVEESLGTTWSASVS